MGYNSAIMICNDVMHEIDKDPAAWWEKAARAIYKASNGQPATFGHGCSANGFMAICNQHADVVTVAAIGGNNTKILGFGYWEDSEEDLLEKLAEKHGYSLRKKPPKNHK